MNRKNGTVTWNELYREWHSYAEHMELDRDLATSKIETQLGQGSRVTIALLEQYKDSSEKRAAIWLAAFCRDLMQDYAYLLDASSYLLVNQIYFHAHSQFKESSSWEAPLTHLQPKFYISYRLLEHSDLSNMQCIVELAMLQARMTQHDYFTV